MMQQFHEPETNQGCDRDFQRRVVGRAARLQQADHDAGMTIRHMTEAAAEVGIQPEYIERAMSLERALSEAHAEQSSPRLGVASRSAARTRTANRADFRRFVTAMSMPIAVGGLGYALKNWTGGAVLLSLILPAPLACLSGFLCGRKRVAFVTAALLALALAPTAYHLGIHAYYTVNPSEIYSEWITANARNAGMSIAFTYVALGLPLTGMLGAFGAWARQRYFPEVE